MNGFDSGSTSPVTAQRANDARECARFIALIHDEPQVWTRAFACRSKAVVSMKCRVIERQKLNGAGYGIVIDLITDTVVATSEIAWPRCHAEVVELVDFVRELHFS